MLRNRLVKNRKSKSRPVALFETLELRQMLSVSAASALGQPTVIGTPSSLANGGLNSPSSAWYTPAQIRAAYGISNIKLDGIVGDGTGQTIAIVTADDDPNLVSSSNSNFAKSDLHIFDKEFGLPDPPSFKKIEQGSGASAPPADTGWALEAALDVEWAHAMAPAANIDLVEADSPTESQFFNYGIQTAAGLSGVSVVTSSIAFGESGGETTYDSDFTTPSGHNGVTFVSSTGDNGAPADYPGTSPNVVSVGGTTLQLSGNSYVSETGYSESGGGISVYEPKPSYQSGVTQSKSLRTTPDVAFDGNPNTGVAVYDSYNGGYPAWYQVAGTSFAAPAWAGMIAIADQGRVIGHMSTLDGVSQTLPKLYSLPSSDFHDITSGNNGYAAGPGYDLVTGRGTPIANLLVPALAGLTTTTNPTGTASISGTVYVDSNGDGKQDNGEAGLAGVKMYIDSNKNGVLDSGEATYTTGSNGSYSFGELPAGVYQIREVLPSGYKLTNPTVGYYNITVQNGWAIKGENWGNAKTTTAPGIIGSMSGYVYVDSNSNGKRDSGESVLSGITVYIDSNKDGKLDDGEYSTTTNSSGYYYFGINTPGVYQIREVVPSGYHLTDPTVGYYDITVQNGWNISNENWGNLK